MMQLLQSRVTNHFTRGTKAFFVSCFIFMFCFQSGAWAQTLYYSKATGDLNVASTWGANTNGTGTSPADFVSALQEFHISNGNPGSLSANWTVSGASSKIVVDGNDFTVPPSQTVTGTIDVNAGRTLILQNPTLPTLGSLNATSTVVYSGLTFTSSFTVPTATAYGNITFDNSTVNPVAPTQTITFAGNFALTTTSSFVGADATAGYNLTTTGTANQTINSNGLTLTVWNLANNNTVAKTGTLTLAANTNMTIRNSIIMNLTGVANRFSDGGNTLTTYNNVSMGGDAAGYNLTGTITPALASGTVKFRGFVSGAASDAAPIAAALNNVTINTSGTGGAAFLPTSGSTIVIKGNLAITTSGTGNLVLNGNTINLMGNLVHTPSTNALNAAGSTLNFSGASNQVYSSAVPAGATLNNVTVANAAGVTLNAPLTVNGTLTLTNGIVSAGANTLTIGAAGSVSGASAASYVNGTLSKTMPAGGTTSVNYEVGDATYAPVNVSFSSSVSAGSVSVKSTAGAHPQAAGSLIVAGNMANHYWTISSTGVAPSLVNISLSYNSADITGGGGSNTGYLIRKYAGTSWTTAPSVTNTATAAAPLLPFASTTTGVTGTTFSADYVAGFPACVNVSPGATVATPANICVSGTSVIAITAASSGPGITYQWQSSGDGVSWLDIPGETNTTYNTGTLTDTIYYRTTVGCQVTGNLGQSSPATVFVNQIPPAISGSSSVCQGSGIILTDAVSGGTWSSSNTSIATVGSATGTLSAVGDGVVTITYMSGACSVTKDITVNPLGAITGASSVCQGAIAGLANSATGGTWSSSDGAVASIGSSDGIVFGAAPGTATITYALGTGCTAYSAITVNPLAPNTGTLTVCEGTTTTLSNINTGGAWASDNTGIATVGTSGIVTGVAQGTANITYTATGGCAAINTVTVYPLAQITGILSACEGLTTTLANINAGGTWTSGDESIATIGSSDGVVSGVLAGNANVTYTLGTGCAAMATVTVNPRAAITGITSLCEGATTNLSNVNTDGTWSSSNSSIADVGSATGVVTGAGAGVTDVAYTLPTGCTSIVSITVNQAPDVIAGGNEVCAGSTLNLTNTVGGGLWVSSDASIATVGSLAGDVNGITAGTITITYALPSGCFTTTSITVNPVPAAIGGAVAVCQNQSITLTNTTPDGTWSSSDMAVATVGSTGVVTGATAGNVNISYTTGTGCFVTRNVTVNAIPAPLNGIAAFCIAATSVFTDDSTGGTWSSSNTSIATTGTDGTITGVAEGTSTISYTLSTGCFTLQEVTVNPLPAVFVVTGGGNYCAGFPGVPVGLSNTEPSIRYELYNGTTSTGIILPGAGTDLDFGLQTDNGVYSVSATNLNTGCKNNMSGTVTVTAVAVTIPSVTFVGGIHDTVCSGVPTLFTATPVNGGTAPVYTWKVNSTITAATSSSFTYMPTDGDVVTVKLTSNKLCAIPDSAIATGTITVIPSLLPFVSIVASPGNLVCAATVVSFTATAVNSGSAPTFMWYRNGVTSGILTTGTYTTIPTDGDVIYTKVHSNFQCPVTNDVPSNTIGMGVYPNYLPIVTLSAHPGFFISPGQSDTLTASVADGGPTQTFQWSVNGVNIAGATNAVYVGVFHDQDSVACTVLAGGPCGRPTFNAARISVSSLNLHPISNTGSDIALFPNPNTGTFAIKGSLNIDDNEPVSIEIVSMTGQMIYKKSIIVQHKDINEEVSVGNTLANGMYLLNVRSANENNVFHFMIQQ